PPPPPLHSFPTRRSSDLPEPLAAAVALTLAFAVPIPVAVPIAVVAGLVAALAGVLPAGVGTARRVARAVAGRWWSRCCRRLGGRSEEHTSELQSRSDLVC